MRSSGEMIEDEALAHGVACAAAEYKPWQFVPERGLPTTR
jgi:hypothetical protein